MTEIEIYIDGSCSGNRGPGGYAAICRINGKTYASGGYTTKETTGNASELRAAILALKSLRRKKCKVRLMTDSQYLVTCSAHDNDWLTEPGRKNGELWFEFIKIKEKGEHVVEFIKVAGHKGNRLNELADKRAKAECAKARHKLYENN